MGAGGGEQRAGRVEIEMLIVPVVEVRWTGGIAERPATRVPPCTSPPVEPLGRELVQYEEGREPPELLERRLERVNVVEDAHRDRSVEWAGVVQLLERHLPEDRPRGGFRVDRDEP